MVIIKLMEELIVIAKLIKEQMLIIITIKQQQQINQQHPLLHLVVMD